MKSDLDGLMAERGFDAAVVMGEAEGNHALRYLTNGAKITGGYVVKKRGEPPVIVCDGMERDEAAKSGLAVITTGELKLHELIRATGSLFEGQKQLLVNVLEHFGISGTVSFYGLGDPGKSYVMLRDLDAMMPGVSITGETETTIFDEAYLTKDPAELAMLKSVAERTNAVMDEVVGFIRQHAAQDGRLVKAGGDALTVGDVKRFLRGRLLAYDLEDGGETIFAIGRDAGVPHSRGAAGDALVLGQSIVFDLFPRDLENGYYHDMTRTFCLGYAPPEVQRAYDQVMQAFDAVMESLAVGEPGSRYQDLTCDVLEEHGHPTPRSHPGTEEGYVHNLGHGLGLQIHSRPRLSAFSADAIQPGQVFTVEPGLYYPSRGFGVRIEDTVVVDEQGAIHSLTPFPKDLVIPVGAGQ